jgi:hypothetical protein
MRKSPLVLPSDNVAGVTMFQLPVPVLTLQFTPGKACPLTAVSIVMLFPPPIVAHAERVNVVNRMRERFMIETPKMPGTELAG